VTPLKASLVVCRCTGDERRSTEKEEMRRAGVSGAPVGRSHVSVRAVDITPLESLVGRGVRVDRSRPAPLHRRLRGVDLKRDTPVRMAPCE
jgi:hypothetical protein